MMHIPLLSNHLLVICKRLLATFHQHFREALLHFFGEEIPRCRTDDLAWRGLLDVSKNVSMDEEAYEGDIWTARYKKVSTYSKLRM
jgi:hypothetical protein